MTIKNKIATRFTFLAGAILLIFSGIFYFVAKSYLIKDFNERIESRIHYTSQLLIKDGTLDKSVVSSLGNNTLNTILNEQLLILSQQDSILLNTFKAEPVFSKEFINSVKSSDQIIANRDSTVWYGAVIFSGGRTFKLLAEIPIDFIEDLQKLKYTLIAGTLLILLVLFFAGRFFAANALRPIARVIKQADEITHSNLHKRLEEGIEMDELSLMAKTFNQLLERLEIAFQLQRDFVSNASHELRTPLSSITAQLEVTLMHNRTNEEYKMVMQSVLDDIRDMNQLSEGLFDLTLASRDVSLMEFAEVRVDELLMQARSELLKRKPEYKINIHIGELPDDERQLIIDAKEHLLKSTFRNLMDNACKFSENKTVDVYLNTTGGKIELQFVDTGIGMPQSYIDCMFTPLLRGVNASRFQGHGLGLALSKKITELHRGEINVNSVENNGTTVKVYLPVE